MATKKMKVRGLVVECWEKSIRISGKDFMSRVIFFCQKPSSDAIDMVCELANKAHDAGKKKAKAELREWLGL